MIEINKYRLSTTGVPVWGEMYGDITKQKDLMALLDSYVDKPELLEELLREDVELKKWVEEQGYLKEHQPIKTVNGESLIGEGNIEISGVSPEQEELINQIPNKADRSDIPDVSNLATKDELEEVEGKIPSLDGYATEEFVKSQGYLTEHQPIKTVNGESLIGEGDIEIQGGGLTPEQLSKLDVILNPKKGIPEYMGFPAFSGSIVNDPAVAGDRNYYYRLFRYVYGTTNVILYYNNITGNIYYFNPDTLKMVKLDLVLTGIGGVNPFIGCNDTIWGNTGATNSYYYLGTRYRLVFTITATVKRCSVTYATKFGEYADEYHTIYNRDNIIPCGSKLYVLSTTGGVDLVGDGRYTNFTPTTIITPDDYPLLRQINTFANFTSVVDGKFIYYDGTKKFVFVEKTDEEGVTYGEFEEVDKDAYYPAYYMDGKGEEKPATGNYIKGYKGVYFFIYKTDVCLLGKDESGNRVWIYLGDTGLSYGYAGFLASELVYVGAYANGYAITNLSFVPINDKWVVADFSDYATQTYVQSTDTARKEWVEEQGYLTEHQPLKTINGETIVGEGDIEIQGGGLTPEQKKAVETLVDSSKGMLYTEDLAPRHINRYDFEDGSTRVVNLDGRVILNRYFELYEFKNLAIHHLGQILGQFDYNSPMWADMSGRIYNGQNYKVDLDTMTSEPAEMNCMFFFSQNNKCSIFKGQNAVYMYGGNQYQVFDEEAQRFGEPLFYSNDENLDVWSFMMNQIQYKGRLISIYNNQTYELVEDADGIHPEVIDNPFDFGACPFTVEGSRMFYIDDIWYYMPTYPYEATYRLIDGTWEQINMTYPEGDTPYFDGYGVISENMVISNWSSYLNVYNLTDEEKKETSWTPVGNKAVDLESSQSIGGTKQFKNAIITPGVSTESVASRGMNLILYASGNLNLNTPNGFVNLPANTLVDGDPAASKSDTIQSSQMTSPGKIRKIYDISGDSTRMYSVVFNNKLYHNSWVKWIFDGETSVNAEGLFPDTYIDFNYSAKITSSRFFLINSDYLYELVDNEFVIREEGTHDRGLVFPYEDTLVDYNSGQKLNTSTWEWEDWVGNISNFFAADRTFVLNGQTYSANDYQLTVFNPDTASFETWVEYMDPNGNQLWSNGNHFIHNGHIYVNINTAWYMVDLENRTIITQTDNISSNENALLCSLNGKVYTIEDSLVKMLYNLEYTKPEVPEADGTYVLKATRVDGQITYTWVLE